MNNRKHKVVWLDINSSYSHSSLALPAIHSQRLNSDFIQWSKVSGTINSVISAVIEELITEKPTVIAYTAWLFNHEMQLKILARYKVLNPSVIIIGGGPEYLGDNQDFLRTNHFIDYVVRGEGEEVFYHWIEGRRDINGLCYIENDTYHDGGLAKVEDYTSLHFPEESPFFDFDKPFIQIESTRGCFNSCLFCVSGADKPVRSLSIDILRNRLKVAQSHGIKDIRLLDRTFNGIGTRAVEMLSLFEEFPQMQFHLEVHPALMTEKVREKIKTLPAGLLHIEAGVQSLNQRVLDGVSRFGHLEDVFSGLSFLCSQPNVEVHSDLIAGLPHYTLDMIYDDVRKLVALGCEEVQLELLKLLPGTAMRQNREILYSPLPPYEVLQTNSISFSELQEARRVSRIIDAYYNCPVWRNSVSELIAKNVDFLKNLTAHITSIGMIDNPMSQERRGTILYEYCKAHYPDKVILVTCDWIKGGLSLKKGAGEGTKQAEGEIPTELKDLNETARIYYKKIEDRTIWLAYDRSIQHSEPIRVIIK